MTVAQAWRCAGRPTAWMAALLLGGCSALQVDVDVYKGALLNQKEVQQRQYAYMAISAEPLIRRMREATESRQKACGDCADASALRAALEVLNDVLAMYTGHSEGLKAAQSSDAQGGIRSLTAELTNAYARPGNGPERQMAIDNAVQRLNEALIYFAQRILFIVNNETLFAELAPAGPDSLKAQKSVLQSLGNTLLVHANDLTRQRDRDLALQRRVVSEKVAIERAFRVTPAVAFDLIVDQARRAAAAPPPEAASGPNRTDDDKARLAALQRDLGAARQALQDYRQGQVGLAAAFSTLVGDPRRLLADLTGKPSATEARALDSDRKAIAALYPTRPADDADRTPAGALAPLRQWLERERGSSVALERKQRLALLAGHLETDQARLLADIAATATRADVLEAMRRRLDQDATLAARQLGDLQARATALDKEEQALAQHIGQRDRRFAEALAAETRARTSADEGQRIVTVLTRLREEVLDLARATDVADEAGVHALLKARVAALKPGVQGAEPRSADLEATRRWLERRSPAAPRICPGDPGDSCAGTDQLDVVDSLITGLRVQRVQALARGDTQAASDLLAAINAAYDQRTAMIYLRPASDYLRSVHSASDLQDAAEPQYRNMLNDWWRYLRPAWQGNPDNDEARRKLELEKLYWQNINRVTLNGGGATNYALAKDDVGNWYVKAYSADPEAIFKSATQLAMFNVGKRLNVNLLQRHDLQSRLDASTDSTERERLSAQLDRLDSQDGRPLLSLQARYARQYAETTRDHGVRLHKALTEASRELTRITDQAAADKAEACPMAELQRALSALDAPILGPARGQLDTLIANPGAAEPQALVVSYEGALQAGLTALHRYGVQAQRTLDESTASGCEAGWRRGLARRLQAWTQERMLDLARERRAAIDRYEDALANITEVATQK